MRMGGAERHWTTLVPALRERGRRGRRPVPCGRRASVRRAAGASEYPSPPSGCAAAPTYAGWRRALACAATRPDAVVSRSVSGQLVGAAIARRAKCRARTQRAHAGQGGRPAVPPRPHQRALTRMSQPARGRGHRRERQSGRAARGTRLSARIVRAQRPLRGRRRGRGSPAPRVRGRRPSRPSAWPSCAPRSAIDAFVEAVQAARVAERPACAGYVAGDGPRGRASSSALAGGSGVRLLGVARATCPT